jgi:hypothetical protein
MDQQINIIRMAHLVPCSIDLSVDIKGDLITNTLFLANKAIGISEILSIQEQLLGVKMAYDEIKDALRILYNKAIVVENGTKYVLSSEVHEQLNRRATVQNKLEENVIQRWINEDIIPNYPELELEEISELKEDILTFLNTLFIRHGTESIQLVSGDVGLVEDMDIQSVLKALPQCSGRLLTVRAQEFERFLSFDDADTVRFLRSLIDRAVTYLTVVCDPQIIETLETRIKDKLIYLDSNVVYRLLGLQGNQRQHVVESVVSLCQKFGLSLRVHSVTINELKQRMKYDSNILRRYPVPRDLAAIGAKYLSEENYVSTYWYEARDKGISVEDFISYYSHIEDHLKVHNIIVEYEEIELPHNFEEMKRELISDFCRTENPEAEHKKSTSALEHDAHLLALVKYLQKGTNSFIDCAAWLLTTDRSIIKVLKSNPLYKDRPPCALMPSQLLQILRFVTPANEEYDNAFLGLFTRSYITSGLHISNEIIQEILGRIAKHRGSPTLAEKILSDDLIMRRYTNTTSNKSREEIIQDAIVVKAKETEAQLLLVNAKVDKLSTDLGTSLGQLEQYRLETATVKEKLKDNLLATDQVTIEKDTALKELEIIKDKNKKQRRILSHIVCSAIFLLSLTQLIYVYFYLDVTTIIIRFISLAIFIFTVPVLCRFIIGKHATDRLAYWMFWCAGIIGLIYKIATDTV